MNKFIILALSMAFSSQLTAQNSFRAEEVFQKAYHNYYSEGKCGQNIRRFVALWSKFKGNLNHLSYVIIKNKGVSVFGMVNAQKARSYIRDKDVNREKNWYFHVIAVDSRGMVYDMDYTIKPQVTPFKKYLYEMYLKEPECKSKKSGAFCAGAARKMRDYQFEWYRAESALKGDLSKPFLTTNMTGSIKYMSRKR